MLKETLCHAGFEVVLKKMVTCFGSASFFLVLSRENPEFHDLMRMDKGHWPRCLLWHGGLPCCLVPMVFLLGLGLLLKRPVICWKCALGPYSSRSLFEWKVLPQLPEGEEVVDVPDAPNAWTDGSLVQVPVFGASSFSSA